MEVLDIGALRGAALQHATHGRWRDAERLHLEVLKREPNDLETWLGLAAVRRADARFGDALKAVDGALAADPRSFIAHLTKGWLLERLDQMKPAAAAYGIALALAPDRSQLSTALTQALDHARSVKASYVSELNDFVRGAIASDQARLSRFSSRRVDAFIDLMIGLKRPVQQQPTQFFYPGLPAIEFWNRELFPWLDAVESETPAICEELRCLLGDRAAGFVPYVAFDETAPVDQWGELNNSLRWSSFHLWRRGEVVEKSRELCPRTFKAMEHLPQARVGGRSPAAMFSVLKPRTRIPPHTGVANTRLVVHLPLIVPPGCGFRVGHETRSWKVGEAWVFDDTIDHEAWNDSDEERAILICDIWNPLLPEAERQIISNVIAALDRFNGSAPGVDSI